MPLPYKTMIFFIFTVLTECMSVSMIISMTKTYLESDLRYIKNVAIKKYINRLPANLFGRLGHVTFLSQQQGSITLQID